MLSLLLVGLAHLAPAEGLKVQFVDVEGGGATLIVTPAGESILIDCGNPGSRDADRIYKACKELNLERLDHMIVTHWHLDHYGGVGSLSKKIPIGRFHDRGIPDTLPDDPANFPVLISAYKEASRDKRETLKAGDIVKLKQVEGGPRIELVCVCGSGDVRKKPVFGDPSKNPPELQQPDPSDNAKSLGFVLSYGNWRFLDLGDLTWNKETLLIHPGNVIGKIDVYQSTHHGLEISNHPELMKQVHPTIAVFNNGPRKGGHPRVMGDLRRIEGFQDIFQLHKNLGAPDSENAPLTHVANASGDCKALGIRITVDEDAKGYGVVVGDQPKVHRFQTSEK